MITAKDLRGVLAIMPTPAKEGADRLDATNTVDLDDTARRIKFVKGLGATGTLLGIPMWQPATLDMAVKFYADVAQTFPDFPIMVYANPRAFRFAFDADFWGPLVEKAPTVMSAKFSSKGILKKSVEASKGRVNFIPPIGLAYEFAQISPESQTTCWIPSVGPQVGLALMKALAARDQQQAKTIADDIAWANEPHHVMTGSQEVFASYNIQLEKVLMAASGYCNIGTILQPYNVMIDDFRFFEAEDGIRDAKLREKYSKVLG